MTDTIKELSGLASKLNQKSDSLNETITTINEKLRKLNLGVEVWIRGLEEGDPWFREEDDEKRYAFRGETRLGYCKVNDVWQLASKDVTVGPDAMGLQFAEVVEGGDGPCALLSSTRSIRIKAMELIPRLLREIKKQAESTLESIEAAQQAAAKL